MKKEEKIDYKKGESVHINEDVWFYPNPKSFDFVVWARIGNQKQAVKFRLTHKKINFSKNQEKSVTDQILKEIIAEIEKLIIEEMLICQQEGTPTSRLTSLSGKLFKLQL